MKIKYKLKDGKYNLPKDLTSTATDSGCVYEGWHYAELSVTVDPVDYVDWEMVEVTFEEYIPISIYAENELGSSDSITGGRGIEDIIQALIDNGILTSSDFPADLIMKITEREALRAIVRERL